MTTYNDERFHQSIESRNLTVDPYRVGSATYFWNVDFGCQQTTETPSCEETENHFQAFFIFGELSSAPSSFFKKENFITTGSNQAVFKFSLLTSASRLLGHH